MDKQLFNELKTTVQLFIFGTEIDDPDENSETLTNVGSVPLEAVVIDVTTKIQWKIPGIETDSAKSITIENEMLSSFKYGHKIEIDGVEYYGYKGNHGSLLIEPNGDDYSSIYIVTRN